MILKKEEISERWSKVETQYQRRFDLIDNLENVVKGAADFEKSTLVAVTEARSAWAQSKETGDRGQQITAINNLDSALSRLLVSVERYPEIKATQAFIQLNTELVGTENRIRQARDNYNEIVKDFNQYVKIFPNSLFANLFGFKEEKFFEASSGAENAPSIEFDFSNDK